MERVRIRNSRQRKWRRMRWVAVIGLVIVIGLVAFLEDHALMPDQLSGEDQYCKVTTDWMEGPFAVETWDDEDLYDFYIISVNDYFMLVKAHLDDGELMDYVSSLFDKDGNYIPAEKTLTGASAVIEGDLKALAMEEMSYYADETLPVSDFELYFYPYCLDITTDGDMSMVIIWGFLFVLLFVIGTLGAILSAVGHHRKMAKLKGKIFYERFVQDWSSGTERMDTRKESLIVLKEFLIVPDSLEMVIPLTELAWCYDAGRRGRKVSMYVMRMNGSLQKLCVLKEKAGAMAEDYLSMIQIQAPWCRVGYTEENKRDFGGMNRKDTLEKIAAEKDQHLSQFSFGNGSLYNH